MTQKISTTTRPILNKVLQDSPSTVRLIHKPRSTIYKILHLESNSLKAVAGRGSRTREKLREFFHGSRPTDLALIFRLCSFLGPYRSPLDVGPPSRRYGFLRFCAWKNRLFPTAEPAHRRIRFLRLNCLKLICV